VTAFIARDGALGGRRFELEGDRTIGREGADITLDDDQVSRSHARVSVAGATVTIEDLGSTNGTFVNGAKIDAATTLAPGDTVRIGATTFALEAEPEPTPAMPEPAVTVARVAAPAAPTPEPAPAPPAAPAPALATGAVGAPREPFGAYLAPESAHHGGGIQSRQRLPILVTYAIVLAVAVALVIYFAYA